MTHFQFNFWVLVSLIQRVATHCVDWFNEVVFSTGGDLFYLSCITIFLFSRHVLRPLLGSAMSSGSSDRVKQNKKGYESVSSKGK